MNRKCVAIVIIGLMLALSYSVTGATELYLEPEKVASLVSPEDGRDSRTLIFFSLPEELMKSDVEIENAVLLLKGRITDAALGQVDVFAVTEKWVNAGKLGWSNTWDKPGKGYTTDYMGRSVSLSEKPGTSLVRLNVTFMVKAWLDGLIENRGMVVAPCRDDLNSTPVKYYFDRDSILLKISYCKSEH
jgi:hypothetical protein